MNEEKDILEEMRSGNPRPFTTPEGYFEGIEDKVRERIDKPSGHPALGVLKPALLLVCMFVAIIGIGYGTLVLTGTLGYKADRMAAATEVQVSDAAESESVADSSFSSMTDDEMLDYLADSLTMSEIENYLAELN